jgi:hypothetical protein
MGPAARAAQCQHQWKSTGRRQGTGPIKYVDSHATDSVRSEQLSSVMGCARAVVLLRGGGAVTRTIGVFAWPRLMRRVAGPVLEALGGRDAGFGRGRLARLIPPVAVVGVVPSVINAREGRRWGGAHLSRRGARLGEGIVDCSRGFAAGHDGTRGGGGRGRGGGGPVLLSLTAESRALSGRMTFWSW